MWFLSNLVSRFKTLFLKAPTQPVTPVVITPPVQVAVQVPTPVVQVAQPQPPKVLQVTIKDPHYLYPGDVGYPTGGYAASQGLPVINTANPPPTSEDSSQARFTDLQIKVATLFSLTAGRSGFYGQEPSVINTLMHGFLPQLQEGQAKVAAGATDADLTAWILPQG